MPPMISDDESMSDGVDVPESVPAKATTKGKGKAPAEPASEDEQEDDSDEEEAEDEYVVEKLLEHKIVRGVVHYKVKWAGWENDSDCTWEPAANLETAALKLKEYHASIGGPPDSASKSKKKGAQKRTASEVLDSPVPSATKKRAGHKSQTNGNESPAERSPFVLPKGSWESDVSHIMSIVEEPEPDEVKPGKTIKILMGFVEWKDGRKSKHPMKTLRTKCPQALLTYYENHLVFAKTEDVPAHLKTEGGK